VLTLYMNVGEEWVVYVESDSRLVSAQPYVSDTW
jgi:hypothetical protein